MSEEESKPRMIEFPPPGTVYVNPTQWSFHFENGVVHGRRDQRGGNIHEGKRQAFQMVPEPQYQDAYERGYDVGYGQALVE